MSFIWNVGNYFLLYYYDWSLARIFVFFLLKAHFLISLYWNFHAKLKLLINGNFLTFYLKSTRSADFFFSTFLLSSDPCLIYCMCSHLDGIELTEFSRSSGFSINLVIYPETQRIGVNENWCIFYNNKLTQLKWCFILIWFFKLHLFSNKYFIKIS